MQDYFLSIGLCLTKGKDVGKPEIGWIVTASIVYGSDTWRFAGKTLLDVERWWKSRVSIFDMENRCLRLVLGWYKTLTTGELEAIATWADSFVYSEPVPSMVDGGPCQLVELYVAARTASSLSCYLSPYAWYPPRNLPPPPMAAFIGKKGWRSKAARQYVRENMPNGGGRRGCLKKRILRLARRACQERLRCLPEALAPPTRPRRL